MTSKDGKAVHMCHINDSIQRSDSLPIRSRTIHHYKVNFFFASRVFVEIIFAFLLQKFGDLTKQAREYYYIL